MTEKQFIDMVIQERIKLLLERKNTPEEETVLNNGEGVIDRLGEEDRKLVEAYLDLMTGLEAESEEGAYLGGFRDGVRLSVRLFLIGFSVQTPGTGNA